MEVQGQRQVGHRLAQARHALGDQRRRRHAGGIPKRQVRRPEVGEPPCDGVHRRDRDIALEGTAEGRGDGPPQGDPAAFEQARDLSETFQRLGHAAVDVLGVVALRCRDEQHHRIHPGLQGALGPSHIGHQRREV